MRAAVGRAAVALLLAVPGTVRAQIISPGELAEAHADLAGISNCTQCHQLRQRGVANDRCLSCHAPLRARIGLGRGLHATSATENCAACHKDHLGAQSALVRFDTASFRHEQTAFTLVEAHAAVGCATCHNPTLIRDREVLRIKGQGGTLERTYLGLGRTCTACHQTEDPHGGQFGADSCADCHTQAAWSGASVFDHADTRYPLTGLHGGISCAACHGSAGGLNALASEAVGAEGSEAATTVYRGLPFEGCQDCHRDPHRGSLGATCSACHSTGGWTRVPRTRFVSSFDHRVTGFALDGAHGRAACASCHEPAPAGGGLRIEVADRAATEGFAPPRTGHGCASCHVDYHRGELDGAGEFDGSDCSSCHTETAWTPSRFDIFAHAQTRFPLTDAHRAVRCASCHVTSEGEELGAYDGFAARTGSDLAHARMRFALDRSDCAACHADDDAHDQQFEDRSCDACHTPTVGYEIADFDHGGARFTLDGAHRSVDCAACHAPASDGRGAQIQYRPLASRCQDCHVGGGR